MAWVIILGVVLASGANLIYFFYVKSSGRDLMAFFNQFPPPELSALDASEVILFSVIFSLGASAVYLAIRSMSNNPNKTFLLVSFFVLIASLAIPLSIPSPPVAMEAKLVLVNMHIIGAIFIVGTLVLLGARLDKKALQ